ncbi:MAG: DUF3352 domain-containing protein [Acidobacteriota bacterium]
MVSLNSKLLTKRYILIIALLAVTLVGGSIYYFYWRDRQQRFDMAEYVPLSAMAFVQIDSLPALLDGIVETAAWRRIAPLLGLSSQLGYLGSTAKLLAVTGLGPDEAVVLARAQYAIVIDGLDGETRDEPATPGAQLEVVPRLAFVIETHASAASAERLLTKRLNLLAHRIYGTQIDASEQDYQNIKIKIYRTAALDRQLVGAQKGSVLIIGNQIESVKSCLDVLLGKRPRLSQDPQLKRARTQLGKGEVFAFMTGAASSRFLQLASLLISKQSTNTNREELANRLSAQLIDGTAYRLTFQDGTVSERYLVLLRSEIASVLANSIRPSTELSQLSSIIPTNAVDYTVIKIAQPADTLEQLLANISAHVDVVISLALRQLVIELGQQYGIEPNDPIGSLIGSEIALINLPDRTGPQFIILVQVRDKLKLLPTVGRYLRRDGSPVRSENYHGVEIVMAGNQPLRAAAFIGDYLVFGARAQLVALIDAQQSGAVIANDSAVQAAVEGMSSNHKQAAILSCRLDRQSSIELMLNVSRLLRTTDGARELLQSPDIRAAVASLSPSVSTLEIGVEGLIMETRSPFGMLTMASTLLADPAGELRESRAETE